MDGTLVSLHSDTKYIISTSGRPTSLARYNTLLQKVLGLHIVYLPISPVPPSSSIDPQNFCNVLRGMNCIGGAISKDIKHSVIACLDSVDDLAREIQSVNTVIVKPNGQLHGFNTDAIGFRVAIQRGLERSGIRVTKAICYGYGGVCSVVVAVLRSLGIETYLCGRRMEEAARRAIEISANVWTEDVEAELFINAAPVTDSPLEKASNFLASLRSCKVAFDHEMPGEFLRHHCEANGVFHIAGTEMYYPQMYGQWALFLGGVVAEDQLPQLICQAEELSS